MKKFTLLFFAWAVLGMSGAMALGIYSDISGPSSACPGETKNYTFDNHTTNSGVWPIDYVRVKVTGTGNTLSFNNINIEGSCFAISSSEIECANGGSDVSGVVTARWVSSGVIRVDAFRAGSSRDSDQVNVTANSITPGSIAINGRSPASTFGSFSYVATASPASHSLSNASWSISPTFGYTVSAPNANERLFNFSLEGNYTLTVSGTVTSPCGNSASRTTSRTIVVDNGSGPQPFIIQDGPAERAEDRLQESSPVATDLSPLMLSEKTITSLSLTPNPVNQGQVMQLSLSSKRATAGLAYGKIFDSNGRLVQELTIRDQATEINTEHLTVGVYYLQVSTTEMMETQSFVVTR